MKLGSIIQFINPSHNQRHLINMYGILEKIYESDDGTLFVEVRLLDTSQIWLYHRCINCYEHRFIEVK